MKTLSIKAKLINCFFALTLVTGLCVPSIASYAYAEPKGEAQNTVAVGESDNRVADFNENDSNELRGSSSSQSSQPVEDQTNKQNELESNSQTQVTTLAEESVATTQSASLAVETRGKSSTAQVATAIGETVNGQDGYISMVGPYEFNATGNTNVRGKYTNTVGQALQSKHVGDLVK